MQLKIQNGKVDLSGSSILNSINIEINDRSKIAVVGRNGCGKTTLLKLISGEYCISKDNENDNSFYSVSGKPKIGYLSQISFSNENITLENEIRSAYSDILSMKEQIEKLQKEMEHNQSDDNIRLYSSLLETFTNCGGFYFEKEYEAAIKKFGFTDDQKYRSISEFSGGQRTKIAFLKLLLSKPDILLLDEPTNHLDIDAVEWLEEYLKSYNKAFVIVSHDRMFLDNVVNFVYEIEHGKTNAYAGNYTKFTELKSALREKQKREYLAQKKEIERLQDLIIKFKYKPTKASMAQSKLKQLERIIPLEAPEAYDTRTFHADFEPDDPGVKDVLSVCKLEIGYDKTISIVDIDIKRGMRVGIIGGNGLGKSTFIKTIMGIIRPVSGEYNFGSRINVGYFDQQMAQYSSTDTVLSDFLKAFPSLNDFEARSALGAFLFSGEDVFKTIDMLSGGERVRLALCKIFKRRPNFLILDEPTNHMDIVGKETLENLLSNYSGTLLFVSHDRYFIKKISDSLLVFEQGKTELYPYGYEQYIESIKNPEKKEEKKSVKEEQIKIKKTFTTPAKEKAKLTRAIIKSEERISILEERLNGLKEEITWEENITDYLKLQSLQNEIEETQTELDTVVNEWEELCNKIEDK